MNKNWLKIAGVLALVAGISFAAVSATQAKSVNAKLSASGSLIARFLGSPAVSGTVQSINGNSLTVKTSNGSLSTVDASNAMLITVKPVGTALVNTGIMVGDNVNVFGTVSGTNVTATRIIDGNLPTGLFNKPAVNGSMKINGTVSAVNGNSLSLNGSNGTTFTVDLSNAQIFSVSNNSKTTIQASGIKTGDTLTVLGTVSGSNVTAKTVIDGALNTGMLNMGIHGIGHGHLGLGLGLGNQNNQ